MKKSPKYSIFLSATIFTVGLISCTKFLDEKPLQTDAVPTKLSELRSLLDNSTLAINSSSNCGAAELLSDNFYVRASDWEARAASDPAEAYTYVWDEDIFISSGTWTNLYQNPIYCSNIVLEHLENFDRVPSEAEAFDDLKGSALFYRALAFYQVAQLFCRPYSTDYANEPGVVLRLVAGVTAQSRRATVEETYERIISDLKFSSELLPTTVQIVSRPSKVAAYAALARVYLSMRQYDSAGHYANLALQGNGNLIDYNTLIPVGSPPISGFNPEVIFHSFNNSTPTLLRRFHRIDSLLYSAYDDNDLRKMVFFYEGQGEDAGTYRFRGSYFGNYLVDLSFDGLTTAEMLLTRAESYARTNRYNDGMADLNTLLEKRWSAGSFTPLSAANPQEALAKILLERRKELVFRGQRWTDIRRLNLEDANIILKRVINGVTYTLLPNEPKSIMLIPNDEIIRSSLQQNPR